MPFKEATGTKKVEMEVQERVETKNDLSEVVATSWPTRYHLRGALKQVSGFEKLQSMAVKAERSHRFYTRFRADVTVTGHRMKCGDRIFIILDIDNVGQKNREMVLLLKEQAV